MKNKGLIYGLLIVVAFIWYKVFFRVMSNFTDDEVTIVEPNATKPLIGSIHQDTFTLVANYRDPFGGKAKVVRSQIETNQAPVDVTSVVKKQKEPWPKIQYKGMLRKTTSTNPLALIYIDGIQLQMRKGESVFDGIQLVSVLRDEILVRYQGEKRSFFRE